MDEKYCIKRTKMNKKGHFAYNLGIWLGLLRASYGFDSRREYQYPTDLYRSGLLSHRRFEGRFNVIPFPVRPAGLLMHGVPVCQNR